MQSRRDFLKTLTSALGAGAGILSASEKNKLDNNRFGVLSDLTLCVGCRKCEWACNEANELPNESIDKFDDTSVFQNFRRPSSTQFTVVNRFQEKGLNKTPLDVKVQCMHCEHPACVSACIVGALQKTSFGAVTYDDWKCIGCRYCMVACPFQVPAYEYENTLTPKVMKCDMCFEKVQKHGQLPACVEICPREAIVFGKRSELLQIAKDRINKNPERYIDHIYGEYEVGGTSWIYLSNVPFSEVGFPKLPHKAPPELTESIQHGIFKGFSGPILLFGLIGILMRANRKGKDIEQ
ncbi:MAG: 4Fe-4S dicluster domain-containing protein [Candidatus Marinimicrobia bacterium]|nr:4Fe-4S dicluster domain-containing protein [Candidatus Neomarinimicrobiota bacterium]MBL7022485.1 4Fe-4S dicluster domain-containing protein [Candidatus Neomarinimicrobiota bacterium]MBL7108660.1 4Fe-4S dicluster domain-containing protein [Candidatus Neomarinimicrobiota bacterium]